MKKFGITCTMIYNGYVEVEAENEEAAMELAWKEIDKTKIPSEIGMFNFGEATADYADEIKED